MRESEKLLIYQRQLVITVLFLLLLACIWLIGFYFGDILRILGISLVLSYMVINLVDWLEKWLKNRALSVVLVYVSLLAVLSVAVLLIVPAVVIQIGQLVQTIFNAIPEGLNKLTQMLVPLEAKFRSYNIEVKAIDILNNVVANTPKPDPSFLVSRFSDVAMSTMTWLLYWISISVVSFYFLLDGHRITESLIGLFPAKNQAFLQALASDADKSLQLFFRGQLVLGLAFGFVMFLIYMALGVQYALLLSVFLGLMEILPVIGPPIGFIPALIAVAFHGMSGGLFGDIPGNKLTQAILLTVIFAVLQQLKDNLVAPKYIGNVIGLHPIMIFLAIMIGARLDGTLGIIFSLPVACVLNVLFSHLREGWSAPPPETASSPAAANSSEAESSAKAAKESIARPSEQALASEAAPAEKQDLQANN